MISSDDASVSLLGHLLTRLGEAEIALPAALMTVLVLLLRPHTRGFAARWLVLLGGGIALTTATKVAFIGWGIGSPALDFTGASGHSMFAAAVYPVLMLVFVSGVLPGGSRTALMLGYAMALLVGISRLAVGAHSVSEVIVGLLIGAPVSALAVAGSVSSLV